MNIDRFIDVDFRVDPAYVFGDLGMPCFADMGPSYEELFGTMSDAEINDAIKAQDAAGGGLDLMVTRIFDQGREGSCVANAYAQANQIVQAKQFGKDKVVQLSAISLYKRIGSSPSSGAMVSDGVEEMNGRGILPLDTPENRERFDHVMPATGFYEKFPRGWEETGKKFAGLEHHVVKTVPGLLSALCQGHPVVVGRQGHSICYCRVMMKDGRRVVKYANSWKPSWGDQGFGYDSESQIRQSASWAAVVRSVVVPS